MSHDSELIHNSFQPICDNSLSSNNPLSSNNSLSLNNLSHAQNRKTKILNNFSTIDVANQENKNQVKIYSLKETKVKRWYDSLIWVYINFDYCSDDSSHDINQELDLVITDRSIRKLFTVNYAGTCFTLNGEGKFATRHCIFIRHLRMNLVNRLAGLRVAIDNERDLHLISILTNYFEVDNIFLTINDDLIPSLRTYRLIVKRLILYGNHSRSVLTDLNSSCRNSNIQLIIEK